MDTQERAFLVKQCYRILDIMTYLIETDQPDGNIIFTKLDNLYKELNNKVNITPEEYHSMVYENRRI